MTRKHLTQIEVEKLIGATRGARHEARDGCLLLLMFRHGLRVSEAVGLQLSQIDIESRVIHVTRLKNGLSTTQPLRADEIKALKAWLVIRRRSKVGLDDFFISERKKPLSRFRVYKLLLSYGEKASLPIKVTPHMLRHSCGYALADRGADTRLIQDYLGHRNIQNTVIYTATNPSRFKGLWE